MTAETRSSLSTSSILDVDKRLTLSYRTPYFWRQWARNHSKKPLDGNPSSQRGLCGIEKIPHPLRESNPGRLIYDVIFLHFHGWMVFQHCISLWSYLGPISNDEGINNATDKGRPCIISWTFWIFSLDDGTTNWGKITPVTTSLQAREYLCWNRQFWKHNLKVLYRCHVTCSTHTQNPFRLLFRILQAAIDWKLLTYHFNRRALIWRPL